MNSNACVYGGRSVVSNDKLVKIPVEHLVASIRNPRPDIQTMIRNLRIIYRIDKGRYSQVKRQLPFFVCATFNPPCRKTENFAYTEFFILDIDHVSAKEASVEGIRKEVMNDERVMMAFVSPGGDGMKIVFRLKERCYDAGKYSLFYKAFAKEFAIQHGMENIIDTVTSDVSRACFISHDPDIFYREDAEPVSMADFMDEDDTLSVESLRKEHVSDIAKEKPEERHEPFGEELRRIQEILKVRKAPVEKAPAYVPEQLNDVIGDIASYIEKTGIKVTEIININYGKKIRTQLGVKLAETNLFFGKKGFSVVKSPKSGTSPELNDVVADLIKCFFAENGIMI